MSSMSAPEPTNPPSWPLVLAPDEDVDVARPQIDGATRACLRDACQRLVDDLGYTEATFGELLGVLAALRSVLEDRQLTPREKVASLASFMADCDVEALAMEMPRVLHDAVTAIDEISRMVEPPRRRMQLAPVSPPDVLGVEAAAGGMAKGDDA